MAYVVSIHAPRAGRDADQRTDEEARRRFNPRAPCGARLSQRTGRERRICFNPRAPCGARRRDKDGNVTYVMFQSTRPVRGATHPLVCLITSSGVSIHAPRAGRDRGSVFRRRFLDVSIHAPRAGRDSNWRHDFPLLPHIYGYSPPQIMIFSVPKSHAPPIT